MDVHNIIADIVFQIQLGFERAKEVEILKKVSLNNQSFSKVKLCVGTLVYDIYVVPMEDFSILKMKGVLVGDNCKLKLVGWYHGIKEKGGDCCRYKCKEARKGNSGASSSASKADPIRRFGAKVVRPHRLTWFNTQKEAKYAPENRLNERLLVLYFIAIRDKIRELGAGYITNEPERCNLTLVREFYTNWDTSLGERTKVKIRGQVVLS
ncbi:hypothetical protein HAX54_038598 [Datura stramonium]|uniref:Uncharacterized protein n=1 Tax=Datura stramonium TaxID=4076 RepID=A0ABS8VNE9_DATST|nr:hypothetical protein [Datura stramonium]